MIPDLLNMNPGGSIWEPKKYKNQTYTTNLGAVYQDFPNNKGEFLWYHDCIHNRSHVLLQNPKFNKFHNFKHIVLNFEMLNLIILKSCI